MFPKPHHQPPPRSQPFPHSFSAAATPPRHSSSSAADDDSAAPSSFTHAMVLKEPNAAGDGASIEVSRRPRGRPPGSKNKPKPVTAVAAVARDVEPAMSPFVLEVPSGSDIVESISQFCRRKNTGLCILNAFGTVADVTLRQPSASHAPTVTFHGRFDILSASATFLPHTTSFPIPNGLVITLGAPQGQIFGGFVAGSLTSAGIVYITAASFNNPSYQRLSSEEEVRKLAFSDVEEDHSSPISGGKDGENAAAADSCSLMPMYGTHPATSVIWTPAARQPPPHHRQY